MSHTSASNSITIRMQLDHYPGLLAKVMTEVGNLGGNTGAIDIVRVNKGRIIRDITIDTSDPEQAEAIQQAINAIEGVEIIHVSDRTFLLHL
ncbi:MAG: NAD-dependent malic enzyme, partial [Opitutae bacterium]|nr:NAD-dependent malic enzyme [Opitutae bacterium]MBT6849813.1 NAD-dependent malic enzyme [Opitutae bacterium]